MSTLAEQLEISPIPEFKGYGVDRDGNVYSQWNCSGAHVSKIKKLKQWTQRNGYKMVRLKISKKYIGKYVHRLILETFVGKANNDQQCRHLNGDKKDNRIENLRWGTPKENFSDKVKHGTDSEGIRNGMAILNETKVRFIKRALLIGIKNIELADQFKVNESVISKIKNNKTWEHISSEWDKYFLTKAT